MSSHCIWRGGAGLHPIRQWRKYSPGLCRLALINGVSVSLYVLHSTSLFGSCCSLFAYRRSEQKDRHRHVLSSAVAAMEGIRLGLVVRHRDDAFSDVKAHHDEGYMRSSITIGGWWIEYRGLGSNKAKKTERERGQLDRQRGYIGCSFDRLHRNECEVKKNLDTPAALSTIEKKYPQIINYKSNILSQTAIWQIFGWV